MTELLTAAQMRAIEQAAIASGEVTGLELMERAGQGVVDAILEWRPELAKTSHRAVVLCGPGNNGGDGFVVARLLHQRGWEVEVFLYGRDPAEIDKLPPDAAENARRWAALGRVFSLTEYGAGRDDPDVFIDAIFGSGLKREVPHQVWDFLGHTERLIDEDLLYKSKMRTVSIDCPSGLCIDGGKGIMFSVSSALTVTFQRAKIGHYINDGPKNCGKLVVKDIGLNVKKYLSRDQKNEDRICTLTDHFYIEGKDGRAPKPWRLDKISTNWDDKFSDDSKRYLLQGGIYSGNKFSHGHALVLSGGVGKGGAARLAARGALRVGAGLVTVGCPPAAVIENAARLDAIMLKPIGDAEGLAEVLSDARITAVCLGPGFGVGEKCRAAVAAATGGGVEPHPTAGRGVVLDADALTSFAEDPAALFALLHHRCVLTPHEGEFGRLFPDLLAKLKAPATTGPAYSKVDATREAAARAGCTVLFKGADTVIAEPSGRCAINSAHYDRAAPWLATAGSGDVLAGMITGLLARGLDPMAAAETAAWLHVEAARKFGPGLIAEDLPEMLPAVFRDLGL